MLDYENQFYSDKIMYICGCDEAGRGPLCGPVVAAACILPKNYNNELINDSKKLSEKQREVAFKMIIKDSLAYGIGYVYPKTIDEINIYAASRLAMQIAIKNIKHKIDLVVSDYMPIDLGKTQVIPLVKGDAKCMCIAAASIIAKVCRDKYMLALDKMYPDYEFFKHKGYPTKLHLEKLKKYGPIDTIYRYSYGPVKKYSVEQIKFL